MRKNAQKVLSAFLVVFLIISSIGASFVFADEDTPVVDSQTEIVMPVDFDFEIVNSEVMAGESFRVNLALDFDTDQMIIAEGILVFSCKIQYDSEKLDILDPNTMLPLEIGADGKPVDGSFIIFGDLGLENALSAQMMSNGNTIVLLYGSRNADGDLFSPGPFVQFAFRAKNDLEINNKQMTSISVIDSGVSVNNRDVTVESNGGRVGIAITPPFKTERVGSMKQNSTLRLSDRSLIGADSEEPLMISIVDSQGEVIEEQQATVTAARYSATFELSEDKYAPGAYTIKYVYGTTMATTTFTLFEKDAEVVIPPTEPDDEPEDELEDESEDKPGNNNNKDDKPGSITGGVVTPPDNKDEEEEPTKPVDKPVVVYPSDIANHWAAENVKYVYDNQLMNGYEDGTFGVENSITRAEFVTVMARLLGLELDAESASAFGDCNGHWATGYIGALASKGIVGGVADGQFAPDDNITREQIAIILSRAFNLVGAAEENSFADDAEISSWAKAGVYAVLEAGYMKGDDAGNFAPLANATRGEVATVIMRLHQGM